MTTATRVAEAIAVEYPAVDRIGGRDREECTDSQDTSYSVCSEDISNCRSGGACAWLGEGGACLVWSLRGKTALCDARFCMW